MSRQKIGTLDFQVNSSSTSHGGLFQTGGDRALHGWIFPPFPGIRPLPTLPARGLNVVLHIHGSAFWRGRYPHGRAGRD